MTRLMVLLVLALAGCASVGEIRDREPIRSAKTDKSVDTVAACIADKWNHRRGNIVSVTPIQDGSSISVQQMFYSNPVVQMVYDVIDKKDHREVVLHPRFKNKQSFADYDMRAIEGCI